MTSEKTTPHFELPDSFDFNCHLEGVDISGEVEYFEDDESETEEPKTANFYFYRDADDPAVGFVGGWTCETSLNPEEFNLQEFLELNFPPETLEEMVQTHREESFDPD